jgi:hypothetical protein
VTNRVPIDLIHDISLAIPVLEAGGIDGTSSRQRAE